MFLEIYTGLYTGRVSPGENAHSVLAKLAYRFINYGMKFPPPFLPARFPLLPLCICGTASWASACVRFVLDSQRDSPLRGRRAVCALLLLVSSCEHKSLFAPRDGFFLLQCALTCACARSRRLLSGKSSVSRHYARREREVLQETYPSLVARIRRGRKKESRERRRRRRRNIANREPTGDLLCEISFCVHRRNNFTMIYLKLPIRVLRSFSRREREPIAITIYHTSS